MMQLHLDEISRNVAKGAHAVLLLDRAGWHITGKLDVPENITPIFLPSREPELNPVENVGNISARTGSQTGSSQTTTRSSTPHATPGAGSPRNHTGSPPSGCETGRTSVSRYDPWYYGNTALLKSAASGRAVSALTAAAEAARGSRSAAGPSRHPVVWAAGR
jgi:hypothetical protein